MASTTATTTTARRTKRRGEHAGTDERLTEAFHKLEEGVKGVLDGEGFKDYLSFQAKFHGYSANNTLLILAQRPLATRVAGYNRWQELGRQVVKGEKHIKIIAPVSRKKTDDETGDDEGSVTHYFKVARVFDVSQTVGDALPEPPNIAMLTGSDEATTAMSESLGGVATGWGITVNDSDPGLPEGVRGRYLRARPDGSGPRIELAPGLQPNHALKTLVHELAHHLVVSSSAAEPAPLRTPELKETEAEGTAFVVLTHFGLDTSGYSFPYIAGWAEDLGVLKQAMSTIQKSARVLIDAVEAHDTDKIAPVEAA